MAGQRKFPSKEAMFRKIMPSSMLLSEDDDNMSANAVNIDNENLSSVNVTEKVEPKTKRRPPLRSKILLTGEDDIKPTIILKEDTEENEMYNIEEKTETTADEQIMDFDKKPEEISFEEEHISDEQIMDYDKKSERTSFEEDDTSDGLIMDFDIRNDKPIYKETVARTISVEQNTETNNSEPDKPETVNVIELLINDKIDVAMTKFNCCTCSGCRDEVYNIALNSLESKIIENKPDKITLAMNDHGTSGAVTTALVQAIIKVKTNPTQCKK